MNYSIPLFTSTTIKYDIRLLIYYRYWRRNREFANADGSITYCCVSQAATHSSAPELSGKVRVYNFRALSAVRSLGSTKCQFIQIGSEDPRANISKRIISWVAEKAAPALIDALTTACEEYPAYLAKKNTSKDAPAS